MHFLFQTYTAMWTAKVKAALGATHTSNSRWAALPPISQLSRSKSRARVESKCRR